MVYKNLSLVILSSFLFAACYQQKHVDSYTELGSEIQEFDEWKQQRLDNLTSPFGWLSVSGLVWLKKNELTIGTDRDYDVTIPHSASANFGTLQKNSGQWSFIPNTGLRFNVEGESLKGSIDLHHDQTGNTTVVNYGSIFWHLIKRGDNYGIRIKDTMRQERFDLKSVPIFDYNKDYVVEAEVLRASEKDSVMITNVQGVVTPTKLMGWLKFKLKGKAYSLAFTNGGTDTWFTVYGDETNSAETYGAGRFLYIEVPAHATKAVIDFNRSENPPCYFTAFATCPLPRKENVLATKILAGERSAH